jgi:phosphoglycolate phosphatase-like HAD superfamily hydrolase
MVGDNSTDVEAGLRAGRHTILLESGRGDLDAASTWQPLYVVPDLASAARLIVSSGPSPPNQ